MKHLTPADYTRQPWKNGKGVTVELARAEAEGALLWRLSMATVAEDGPFSLFPGIERNLTVISGPGFRLVGGGVALECPPLHPVAFPGDVALSAHGTARGASDDFNVMTARHLPRPVVRVTERPMLFPAGDLLALFALGAGLANEKALARHDLILSDQPIRAEGHFLSVRLTGVSA
jgi:environmental stress-induced protein Ves